MASLLSLPNVNFSLEGWGPPERGDFDAPNQAFQKNERFGRPCEFWGSNQPWMNKQQNRGRNTGFGDAKEFDEDTGFTFVDSNKLAAKPSRLPFRVWQKRRPQQQQRQRGGDATKGNRTRLARVGKQMKNFMRDRSQLRRTFVHRTASVDVKPTWKVVAQLSLADLQKLDGAIPLNADIKTLRQCGQVETFDNAYDKISAKQAPPLGKFENKSYYSVSTAQDPIIRELAVAVTEQEREEGAAPEHVVYATDSILATIMTATRSINSWDLSFQVMSVDDDPNGTKIVFIDKRDDEADMVPVNETAREPPQGEAAMHLAEELLLVNQQLSQQVLKKPSKFVKIQNCEPNPFAEEGDDIASTLYKYRQWNVADKVKLVARCQLDGCTKHNSKDAMYRVFALLEYDHKATDWRRKLEAAAGAALATEIKNNACTLAKWAAQCILSGVDQMKLGYVTRQSANNRLDHDVLACHHYGPMDFALSNLALKPRNMWAVLRHIIQTVLKLPDGRYMLLKDPHKPALFLYCLPPEEYEDEDAEEESEEEEMEM